MSKVLVLKAAPALALAAPTATGGAMTTTGAATGGAMTTTGGAARLGVGAGAGAVAGKEGAGGLIGVLNKPKEIMSGHISRAKKETPFGDEQQMAQKEAENRAAYQRLSGESRQLMREGANINTTQFS